MNEIARNPILTRADLVRAAQQLIDPVVSCLSPGKARLLIGEGSAHYS